MHVAGHGAGGGTPGPPGGPPGSGGGGGGPGKPHRDKDREGKDPPKTPGKPGKKVPSSFVDVIDTLVDVLLRFEGPRPQEKSTESGGGEFRFKMLRQCPESEF